MLVVCKKCNVEHDARDVNNGVCYWCEQKENTESAVFQRAQSIIWNRYHPVSNTISIVYDRKINWLR